MMRKNLFFLMIVAWINIFAACSDNKNDQNIADKVAGTYVGTMTVTQEDGSNLGDPLENQKIYITKTGDNMVDLELKNFEFGEIPVGDLKVTNARVSDEGKINGSASAVPIMGGALKADLTLSGEIKDNKADLLIVVNAPLAPGGKVIVMNVTFVGSK